MNTPENANQETSIKFPDVAGVSVEQTPREVIARGIAHAIEDAENDDEEVFAALTLDALAAAGFVVLPQSEVDRLREHRRVLVRLRSDLREMCELSRPESMRHELVIRMKEIDAALRESS